MRNLAVLFIHLLATLARLLGPGGVRSIVAETDVDWSGNRIHLRRTFIDGKIA